MPPIVTVAPASRGWRAATSGADGPRATPRWSGSRAGRDEVPRRDRAARRGRPATARPRRRTSPTRGSRRWRRAARSASTRASRGAPARSRSAAGAAAMPRGPLPCRAPRGSAPRATDGAASRGPTPGRRGRACGQGRDGLSRGSRRPRVPRDDRPTGCRVRSAGGRRRRSRRWTRSPRSRPCGAGPGAGRSRACSTAAQLQDELDPCPRDVEIELADTPTADQLEGRRCLGDEGAAALVVERAAHRRRADVEAEETDPHEGAKCTLRPWAGTDCSQRPATNQRQ